MVRLRAWLITFLALGALITVFVSQAQETTDEGKPILKAHSVNSTSDEKSPTPKASPKKKKKSPTASATPKPKAKKKNAAESEKPPTPSETPDAKARKSPTKTVSPKPSETPEATPHPKPKKSPTKEASVKGKKKKKAAPEKSPTPHKKKSARPPETPSPQASATPARAIAVPSASPPPAPVPRSSVGAAAARSTTSFNAPVEEPEQLTIEKYGYEKPRGFWARLFGGGGRSSGSGAGYRYLTASVRAQIDRAPVARGRWQYIVVHNSGTRQGNAAAFDYYHRHFRRMQNGLAYHFVIGNGTSTGNGQVEIGDRWRRQINGGHVHSDYLNNIALGICLVGDFNRDQPTRAQLECCEELIRYLRQRCGKVGDHWPIVKPHREINPPRWATDCPGDVFPYSWFRRFQQ